MSWLSLAVLALRIVNMLLEAARRRRLRLDVIRELEAGQRRLSRTLLELRQRVEHMSDAEIDRELEGDYRD